ncbi:MAG TPA: cytochrome d ubiquinol oxidase subunit II [Baekduia sp.]
MTLADVPMLFILAGLIAYVTLAGPDFGAAVWQVTAGRGKESERLRDLAHDAMAPVWEANHVWLIFVLTVMWTSYPTAFGSIASTLCVALFIAGLGIVVRGAAYALRSGAGDLHEQVRIDAASAVSSILTPFALGAAIGGVASGRVPVGNAAGDLITSWINPTSLITGAIAVAASAYLAAVFLSADAIRLDQPDLSEAFRRRALGSGVVAGILAAAGLVVLHDDAYRIYHGLVSGDGLPALIVSALAGVGTLALVVLRRYEPARYSAGLAVAAIVVGWALAQKPELLPGLTVHQAAASHDTLWAVIIAVIAGGLIVFPSLALLFRLTLLGTLRGAHGPGHVAAEPAATAPPRPGPRALVDAATQGLLARVAVACLVVGFGFLSVLDAGWAHAIGVVALFAFIVVGFFAALPRDLGVERPESSTEAQGSGP